MDFDELEQTFSQPGWKSIHPYLDNRGGGAGLQTGTFVGIHLAIDNANVRHPFFGKYFLPGIVVHPA